MSQFMQRALSLAELGRYSVSPNPMVGCVIVRDDRIIGEGFHERAGLAHAEVVALRNCTESPRGATVYVTLQPCNHTGRTPPCVDALIEAGVGRVVAAMKDPTPAGIEGFDRLRAAGIEVETGDLSHEAEALNEKFLHANSSGLPFVLLKGGITLDGKLATVTGESQWITSADSRERALALREEYDAILVGSGTVVADDPNLTRRLGWNTSIVPFRRVILDAQGAVPPSAKILNDARPTILYTAEPRQYVPGSAVEVVEVEESAGRVDLLAVLRDLHSRGVQSLMVEGGARVHSDFIERRLWHKMVLFIAPMLVGGHAPALLAENAIEKLDEAYRLRFSEVQLLGADMMVTAYPF
jgi:diaminohydroxyphosphoribosylaminopyrimidine deaminase/5-amino-6-(5-phosphoribosylamino)uracil reductase